VRWDRGLLARLLPDWLCSSNGVLYRACRSYVDRCNGENDVNMSTNGEVWLMREILPLCRTVFDVGANIGEWTAMALKINSRLHVHCFEPSVATFQYLQARVAGAGAICNNVGLGSAPGATTLWIFAAGAGINSLYKRHGLEDGWGLVEQREKETVQLNTLDAYCRHTGVQMIDFMKMDVEGHELEVLRGAVGMLAQGKIKRIQFEYGGCNIDARLLLEDMFAFLVPYGYTFYKVFPRKLQRVQRYDQRLENFQYQNWAVVLEAPGEVGAVIPD
jgi:FkbM family methyltransferase